MSLSVKQPTEPHLTFPVTTQGFLPPIVYYEMQTDFHLIWIRVGVGTSDFLIGFFKSKCQEAGRKSKLKQKHGAHSGDVCVLITQSCQTPCDHLDGRPPGSSVHGILQARILEWAAFPISRGFSRPRDWTQVSPIAGIFFTSWTTREAQEYWSG